MCPGADRRDSPAQAAAVVLAAGEARRFGGPKLAMPFGDSTVIGCVVSALAGAGLAPIIVVVGANRAAIEAALAGADVQFVHNPDPARGMLSSIQIGVALIPRGGDRFVVALADQPRVTAAGVRQLLAAHRASGKGIALPTYGGKRGHPVLFDDRYRDEILALGASAALRDVIHAHLGDMVEVELPSDAFVRDIDTREQYEDERSIVGRACRRLHARRLPSDSRGIFSEIVRLQRAGRRAALATPLWHTGSVPLSAESKLLLLDDGATMGTVGGGLLEAQVLETARRVLAEGKAKVLEFELTADEAARVGMICGGRCAVLIEPIRPDSAPEVFAAAAAAAEAGEPAVFITLLLPDGETQKLALLSHGPGRRLSEACGGGVGAHGDAPPERTEELPEALRTIAEEVLKAGSPRFIEEPVRAHLDPIIPRPTVFIFGAGHVAIPVAHIAALVGFRLVVIDDRPEFANSERFPSADQVMVASVEEAFRVLAVDETSYLVTITRGHALDEEVVAHALRTPARYIGMIGSKRKVAGVFGRLRERGFTDGDLARVHAPIGVDIGAETVEEIAVSIVAELIAARRNGL